MNNKQNNYFMEEIPKKCALCGNQSTKFLMVFGILRRKTTWLCNEHAEAWENNLLNL